MLPHFSGIPRSRIAEILGEKLQQFTALEKRDLRAGLHRPLDQMRLTTAARYC